MEEKQKCSLLFWNVPKILYLFSFSFLIEFLGDSGDI